MELELKIISKTRRENATSFFRFAVNNPCKNRLFIENNMGNVASLQRILSLENARARESNKKLESICKELSISPQLLTNRDFLINRLVFNENILSDFLVIALNESKIFKSKLFKLIDKNNLRDIRNSDIIREKLLWDENDIKHSGRADIQIDIYEKLNCSIFIEHKIHHTLSSRQIEKYCHSGRKSNNSYFVLLSSKDCDYEVLKKNSDIITNSFAHTPVFLSHYSILKILIQTIKEDKIFSHKHLLFWLFEIVYNFKNENTINSEMQNNNNFTTNSNFTLTTLESCYG